MLKVGDLRCGYGPNEILHGVSIFVPRGHLVVVTGAYGKGKSTLLRAIGGLLPTLDPTIICLDDEGIAGLGGRGDRRTRRPILMPETLHLFEGMNVGENLLLGAFRFRCRGTRDA
jgi:ABC-type branched-subunit amino acid transport system ATPase component